jgi:glutamate synthase domain-containing protein 2
MNLKISAEHGEFKYVPDFISIDGAEGGTGAAPLEFANYVGTPLYLGLVMADKLLIKYGVRKEIKIIASGKVFNGFGILKAIAMGADLTQSARAMMLSIGCIHAQLCNTNTCPVGIATQDKRLMKGLDPKLKSVRAANYHKIPSMRFSNCWQQREQLIQVNCQPII